MSITFPSVEEAVAAHVQSVVLYGRIGGTAVTITEATVRHGVDQPVGTCSVIVEAPRPDSLVMGAELEVEAGYPGASRRIFHGRIPLDEASISDNGRWCRVEGEGWASYLRYRSYDVIEMPGPISLKEAFRSLCELRGVPTYLADETTYVDGVTEIMLGGNEQVDGGTVRISANTSPLDWLVRTARLFGYRVFDCPDGAVRLALVNGLPDIGHSAMTYSEGFNAFRFVNRRDVRQRVTYWDVRGKRYTDADGDADGGTIAIRSIPDEVPYDEELCPPCFAADTLSDEVMVTETLAQGARNAHEVAYAAGWTGETWDCVGHPALQPADIVTVETPTCGIDDPAARWLMSISQSVSNRGYEATMEGWAGAGVPLAAGNDCASEPVGVADAYHLGNQTLSRYRDPSPDGTSVTIPITVNHSDSSSLRLTGIGHGCNSFSNNTASTGSVVEVWQKSDPDAPESGENELRRVGSLTLPTLDENSNRAYNYAVTNEHWTEFSLPMPGSLKQGAAELRLISGTNPDGFDDYEVTDLMLTYCGVGTPILPGGA